MIITKIHVQNFSLDFFKDFFNSGSAYETSTKTIFIKLICLKNSLMKFVTCNISFRFYSAVGLVCWLFLYFSFKTIGNLKTFKYVCNLVFYTNRLSHAIQKNTVQNFCWNIYCWYLRFLEFLQLVLNFSLSIYCKKIYCFHVGNIYLKICVIKKSVHLVEGNSYPFLGWKLEREVDIYLK